MNMAITKAGDSVSFAYTGKVQTYKIPFKGLYKLEVWGSASEDGVKGGYACGYKVFDADHVLYICCGGRPYNGGGDNGRGDSSGTDDWEYFSFYKGGGATHIADVTNTLANIGKTNFDKYGHIVAGGGGARGWYYGYISADAVGGGEVGGTVALYDSGDATGAYRYPTAGTQSGGYKFGQGQSGGYHTITTTHYDSNGSENQASNGCGGGGYYGGCTDGHGNQYAGAGGSGWIGGVPIIENCGKSYLPSFRDGINSGTGKATITLVNFSYQLYLGDEAVSQLYLGDTLVSDAILGER